MNAILKSTVSDAYAAVYPIGSSMHKYCVSKTANAVALNGGLLFCFEKPSIETSFCFGYRLSSYDSSEYDAANNMASHVKNDAGAYFKANNLRGLLDVVNLLKSGKTVSVMRSYNDADICSTVYDYESYNLHYTFDKYKMIILSKDDINKLLEMHINEYNAFEKRLNTYLKKYGTSKLKTWSYWSEA